MTGLICIAGGKGAPGATTLALALAISKGAAGADRSITLIDADPDGGDIASRIGVTSTPGLVTLAAATRHTFGPDDLSAHTQQVAPNVRLLASPSRATRHRAHSTSLGRQFTTAAAASEAVADVGTVATSTPPQQTLSQMRT